MITDRLKELAAVRAQLADLEAAVQHEMAAELSSLPGKYGFASVADFSRAVFAAAGTGPRRRGRPPKTAAAAGTESGGKKRRHRAVITDETRQQVKKLVAQDKTGAEIALALKISLPSVQNIKKALGLVKGRKN